MEEGKDSEIEQTGCIAALKTCQRSIHFCARPGAQSQCAFEHGYIEIRKHDMDRCPRLFARRNGARLYRRESVGKGKARFPDRS
jgi:hypothetical protein